MEKFLIHFLGTADTMSFAIAYTFSVIGLATSLGIGVLQRNKRSPFTPEKFSGRFLLLDNALRIFISLLILFVVVRFNQELNGEPLSFYTAIGLGLGFDQAVAKIKSLTKRVRT